MSAYLFDLNGKQALVTGGAQGLGRMIAEGLIKAGASVAITSRKRDIADRAAKEMGEFGNCLPYAADLSNASAAADFAMQFSSDVERCDILINNAGKTWGAPIEKFPDSAWSSVIAVNVEAPFVLVRELLPLIERSATRENPARIINIGSVAGEKTERLQAYSYSASKAAIHMMSRDLAGDLASRHINVNAIVPGFFPTKMTAHVRDDQKLANELRDHIPMGRLGTPDEIAGVAVFLCSRAGGYITGARIPVDGGLTGCG